MVGQRILASHRVLNLPEYRWVFANKPREERHSAGLLGERSHFVIGLEKVEISNWTHGTVTLCHDPSNLEKADRIDGNSGLLQHFSRLIERDLAECIESCAHQEN